MTPQQVFDLTVGQLRAYRQQAPTAHANYLSHLTPTPSLTTTKVRYPKQVRDLLADHFILLARLQQVVEQPRNQWESGLRGVARDFNLSYQRP